jgi:uncharacterized protein YdcH (DUF465 family)
MILSEDVVALLASILAEWNRAETDIKIAEQVANKVVNPSIKELRYAGRRIVDALLKVREGGSPEEVKQLLTDALFDCHRARHDAIDAGTSKVALDLEVMTDKIGYDILLRTYPNFPALFRNLNNIRKKIAESRGNRDSRRSDLLNLRKRRFCRDGESVQCVARVGANNGPACEKGASSLFPCEMGNDCWWRFSCPLDNCHHSECDQITVARVS